MLSILFLGDINGKIGRQAVKKILPALKLELRADLVIANADNLAHGNGVNEASVKEMMAAGVNCFTGGDHCFGNAAHLDLYNSSWPVLRPANYSRNAPGRGYSLIGVKSRQVLIISLIGQVFMSMNYDNPFMEIENILFNLASNNISAIIIDIHAEATSEKAAIFHYLNGRVSAVLGTHTHVMTADARISDQGTAFMSDAGMTGFAAGVLGVAKEGVIKTFLSQIKQPHILPETGRAIFNAVYLEIDEQTGHAKKIEPITKFININ